MSTVSDGLGSSSRPSSTVNDTKFRARLCPHRRRMAALADFKRDRAKLSSGLPLERSCHSGQVHAQLRSASRLLSSIGSTAKISVGPRQRRRATSSSSEVRQPCSGRRGRAQHQPYVVTRRPSLRCRSRIKTYVLKPCGYSASIDRPGSRSISTEYLRGHPASHFALFSLQRRRYVRPTWQYGTGVRKEHAHRP